MLKVPPQAQALVGTGRLTEDGFRDFAFTNPIHLLAGMNPDFFKGTVVETAVEEVLAPA
jgi:hypothetical protein